MIAILSMTSIVIGVVGVFIMVWGVLLTTIRLMILEVRLFRQKSIYQEREILRHQLGSYLLLSLEFLIAADIIATVTHPTLKDMAVLASIVLIRTAISYFLQREVMDFSGKDRS